MDTDEKDISETIEDEAAALEAGDPPDNDAVKADGDDAGDPPAGKDDPPTGEDDPPAGEDDPPPEYEGIQAPEHWEASIREAFEKADPVTQNVWLEQQKEFQRGFNTVSQEAAQLRRYQEQHVGVQGLLDQVIPSWQAQGMTPEQGLGQLVQLGMAYASNPQQTLIHLAEMAGLDLNTLGEEAPYRTSDDIARDNRMRSLEQRLAQQDASMQTTRQSELERDITAFQNQTDAEGNPANPYFAEAMDTITNMYANGYSGTLAEAYEQAIWTTPDIRQKMMSSVPATDGKPTDQQRDAAAKKAINASSQRVKQSRPAPKGSAEMDDLSQDDLVARVAAQMEANG